MKLLLVNPNTNARTTAAMLEIARAAAPEGVELSGMTALSGVPLIMNAEALDEAGRASEAMLKSAKLSDFDGVIIAAFGDPALVALREWLSIPVTGIAEAGMAEAANEGRKFAVVTTTPDLVDSITTSAGRYGHAAEFLGVELTEGEAEKVTNNHDLLPRALEAACLNAITRLGAAAIVIGGGPLAVAARRIAGAIPVPLIEPVPAAVRFAVKRARMRVAI